MTGRLEAAWHWLTTSRYTLHLEAEIERLRAENAALRDSLLGTAGIRPIEPQRRLEATETLTQAARRPLRRQTMRGLLQKLTVESAKRAAEENRKERERLFSEWKEARSAVGQVRGEKKETVQ